MKSIALTLLTLCVISAADYTVRIESGDRAYKNVIITAPLPAAARTTRLAANGTLRSATGHEIYYQQNVAGDLVFVLPELRAQSVQRFTITAGSTKPFQGVHADHADGRIILSSYGKKVFVYQGAESELPRPDIKPVYKRGGYLHPVYTPSGRLVTDDFPTNHVHHHGIWFPWTKTSFEERAPDFWNMGEGKGKVEFVDLDRRWTGGPVHAGFQARHRFIDLTGGAPKIALNETWTVTGYHLPGADYFAFDLVSTQTCATASPLILPKYHYGGLGFRGNWDWNGKDKTRFLTSEGETDRVKGNETRGNWCHLGGEVNGQFAGVAILGHPDNFRAPQPMRLHPSEPFFCFAPSQLGDWQIEPGKPYVSRYRFIVRDGNADKDRIEEIYYAYAHPPKVTIEMP